jgi:hypothetical protein
MHDPVSYQLWRKLDGDRTFQFTGVAGTLKVCVSAMVDDTSHNAAFWLKRIEPSNP